MSIVIDASVAVKWVLPERGTDAALSLLEQDLIAPALWLAEAGDALWRHVRLGELTPDEAMERMAELQSAPVTAVAIKPHMPSALALATDLKHPIYDCIYLAVALHRDTHVVTDDRRFGGATRRPDLAGRVRLLGA